MRKLTAKMFAAELSAALAILVVGAAMFVASASGQDHAGGRDERTLGNGSALVYENCYEQVGAFRVPIADIGVVLPAGFRYQTFDPAGTIGQLVVVGLDCELGGTRVRDVFVNAAVVSPPGFGSNLVRIRGYTSHPRSATRFAQWCFGDVMRLGHVETSAEINPPSNPTGRIGRVFGTGGLGSIEMLTSTPGNAGEIAAARIRHFTVKKGEVHGILEFTADKALRDLGTGLLILDGNDPIVGIGGQHVYPASGDPFTFTFTGLTACPPGLDWID